MSAARTLTDADLDAIADRVVERLRPKPKRAKRGPLPSPSPEARKAIDRMWHRKGLER